jgi:hypothetical protein
MFPDYFKKACRDFELYLHSFFTPELRGQWLSLRHGLFASLQEFQYPLNGRLGGPQPVFTTDIQLQ